MIAKGEKHNTYHQLTIEAGIIEPGSIVITPASIVDAEPLDTEANCEHYFM